MNEERGYNSYAYVAIVDGIWMEFATYSEYIEYITE